MIQRSIDNNRVYSTLFYLETELDSFASLMSCKYMHRNGVGLIKV